MTKTTKAGRPIAPDKTPLDTTFFHEGNANFRLRLILHVSDKDLISQERFKLQTAERVGTCDAEGAGETYNDVTNKSGLFQYYNNLPDDGDYARISTEDPKDVVPNHGKTIEQKYLESNEKFSNRTNINANEGGLFDLSLTAGPAFRVESSYCFRVIKDWGEKLAKYDVIPEISAKQNTYVTDYEEEYYLPEYKKQPTEEETTFFENLVNNFKGLFNVEETTDNSGLSILNPPSKKKVKKEKKPEELLRDYSLMPICLMAAGGSEVIKENIAAIESAILLLDAEDRLKKHKDLVILAITRMIEATTKYSLGRAYSGLEIAVKKANKKDIVVPPMLTVEAFSDMESCFLQISGTPGTLGSKRVYYKAMNVINKNNIGFTPKLTTTVKAGTRNLLIATTERLEAVIQERLNELKDKGY